jgi:hypothetical protein
VPYSPSWILLEPHMMRRWIIKAQTVEFLSAFSRERAFTLVKIGPVMLSVFSSNSSIHFSENRPIVLIEETHVSVRRTSSVIFKFFNNCILKR